MTCDAMANLTAFVCFCPCPIWLRRMESWAPDKKEKGLTINKVPKGNIYLKTPECVEICKELTANKDSLDAAAAMKTSASMDNLAAAGAEPEPAPRAEEGVPPTAGAEGQASPVVRPPRDDEEQI